MFFNNYSKPGKGVNKRNPEQPRMQIFFDVLPRKLWDLLKLHILLFIGCNTILYGNNDCCWCSIFTNN